MSRTLTALGNTLRKVVSPFARVPYTSGTPARVEIPKNLLGRSITLRLTGNLIIGTANAAAIFNEAPLGLIQRVDLVCDGALKTILSASGSLLHRLSHYTRHKISELSAPSATVGTRAFAATLKLDLDGVRMVDPAESLSDLRRFKKVELVIYWGTAAQIATAGGGGTIAIDTANTFIDGFVNQVTSGARKILFEQVVSTDQAGVNQSNTKFDFNIPQAGLLTGILIRTTRDAGAGSGPVLVDDIISSIQVISNNGTRHLDEIGWAALQRENVVEFQLDAGAFTGGPQAGYVFIDFLENGDWSSALNVNAIGDPKLRLNIVRTSGTELIEVLYVFGQPRRELAAA